MENEKKTRKVNLNVSISKNFNKVDLGLVDETIEFEDELEFERKVKMLYNSIRSQVLIELHKICGK